MKRLFVVWLILISLLLSPIVVLASSYTGIIQILNTESSPYTNIPVSFNVSNTWYVDQGFMGADARDTRVKSTGGNTLPHMVTDTKTLVVVDLSAETYTSFYYTMGNVGEDFDIISLSGNVTVASNETIELGTNFLVEIAGYFSTTADYIGDNIILKSGVFRVYISAAGSITVDINSGAAEVTAPNIPSGYHVIIIESNDTDLTITVDSTLRDTGTSASVTPNESPYVLGGDATPYIKYLKITS